MAVPKKLRDRRDSIFATRRRDSNRVAESLEPRRLMSVSFTTVDTVVPQGGYVAAMTSDPSGSVYAVGQTLVGNAYTVALREKPAGSPDTLGSWVTMPVTLPPVGINGDGMAADASGDLFMAGTTATPSTYGDFAIWELPKGSSTFVQIDDAGPDKGWGLAVDPAGNVYAVGTVDVATKFRTTPEWTVRKGTFNASTGKWSFATVDQLATANPSEAVGVSIVTTTINGAPSTGIYVAGTANSCWAVRKSVDGGKTWSQVDTSTGTVNGQTLYSQAFGVSGDMGGNVYVTGVWTTATLTGYDHKTPIYSYTTAWTTRKSADGGASWKTDDTYHPSSTKVFTPRGMGHDLAGNMYAVGYGTDGNNIQHAIIRSNIGGSWTTVDDYTPAGGSAAYNLGAFALDAAGNVYAGGRDSSNGWLIRSASPGAAVSAATTTTAASIFSSAQIKSSSFQAAPASQDDDLRSVLE